MMVDAELAQWQEQNLIAMQQLRFMDAPEWLKQWRQRELQIFLERGFPKRNEEQWKYTNLAKLTHHHYYISRTSSLSSDIDIADYQVEDCYRLVFIDSCFMPHLSDVNHLPTGVILQNCKSLLTSDYALPKQFFTESNNNKNQTVFAHLNAALMTDGLFLYVPKNCVLDKPIHLLYINTLEMNECMNHPRNIIIAEESSKVALYEEYVGKGNGYYFNNVMTNITAKKNANINHYKLQRESRHAFHIANIAISQSKDSTVKTFHCGIGSLIARDDLNYELQGSNASCQLNGFFHAKHKQHIDNHTRIDHLASNSSSQQLYKGILDQQSRGVFNGKIIVHPKLQKISAEQSNPNLLLSSQAEIDSKPELEIYSDDVKCSHGATVGQLDENALFYMRSRGIHRESAQQLLTCAFANELLQMMPEQQISNHIEKHIMDQISATTGWGI